MHVVSCMAMKITRTQKIFKKNLVHVENYSFYAAEKDCQMPDILVLFTKTERSCMNTVWLLYKTLIAVRNGLVHKLMP